MRVPVCMCAGQARVETYWPVFGNPCGGGGDAGNHIAELTRASLPSMLVCLLRWPFRWEQKLPAVRWGIGAAALTGLRAV